MSVLKVSGDELLKIRWHIRVPGLSVLKPKQLCLLVQIHKCEYHAISGLIIAIVAVFRAQVLKTF